MHFVTPNSYCSEMRCETLSLFFTEAAWLDSLPQVINFCPNSESVQHKSLSTDGKCLFVPARHRVEVSNHGLAIIISMTQSTSEVIFSPYFHFHPSHTKKSCLVKAPEVPMECLNSLEVVRSCLIPNLRRRLRHCLWYFTDYQ